MVLALGSNARGSLSQLHLLHVNVLEQWFSNFSVHQTYRESFLKPRLLGLTPRVSDKSGVWSKNLPSDKLPDTDAASWSGDHTLRITGLEDQYPKMI